MTQKSSFAAALRTTRKARGLSQEAFSDVSSRTYLSSLERGLKSPTLNKVAELCAVMEVHPLTLLTLAYAADCKAIDKLFARLRGELDTVLASKNASKS
jgi:transcriptional regulator with XRE-family HTH domain